MNVYIYSTLGWFAMGSQPEKKVQQDNHQFFGGSPVSTHEAHVVYRSGFWLATAGSPAEASAGLPALKRSEGTNN